MKRSFCLVALMLLCGSMSLRGGNQSMLVGGLIGMLGGTVTQAYYNVKYMQECNKMNSLTPVSSQELQSGQTSSSRDISDVRQQNLNKIQRNMNIAAGVVSAGLCVFLVGAK